MPASNTAIVVELGSGSGVAPTTAQGSKVVMLRGIMEWNRWRVEASSWAAPFARTHIHQTAQGGPTQKRHRTEASLYHWLVPQSSGSG